MCVRSEHEANTERLVTKSSSMRHVEGGWPKDVDFTEQSDVSRFRKKAEKDEDYKGAVKALGPIVARCMKQVNTIDIYEVRQLYYSLERGFVLLVCPCVAIRSHKVVLIYFDSFYKPVLSLFLQEYFEGDNVDHSSEPPSAKGLAVFRDPLDEKRTATSINWHPDPAAPAKIAVSYSDLTFQNAKFATTRMPQQSFIWDILNPNTPDSELLPPSPLCCLRFNPKNTDSLVGTLLPCVDL